MTKTPPAALPAAKTSASKSISKAPAKTTAKTSAPAEPKATTAAKVVKAAKPVLAPKPAKPTRLRQKPIRDSFTMPATDFALIAALKTRTLSERRETKKSELLRAGLHVLAALDTPALMATLGKLDTVKVGRPKKNH